MNKLFLSVTSMLVTHFILKIVDKVKGRAQTEEHKLAEHDATMAHLSRFLDKNPPDGRLTECAERNIMGSCNG